MDKVVFVRPMMAKIDRTHACIYNDLLEARFGEVDIGISSDDLFYCVGTPEGVKEEYADYIRIGDGAIYPVAPRVWFEEVPFVSPNPPGDKMESKPSIADRLDVMGKLEVPALLGKASTATDEITLSRAELATWKHILDRSIEDLSDHAVESMEPEAMEFLELIRDKMKRKLSEK